MSEGSNTGSAPTSSAEGDKPELDLVGQVISDRFRVVSQIARGGMGKVYRAEQLPLGRTVALKVLDPKYEGELDPNFHKRFFLEASVCANLTHRNTITIYDYGVTDDNIYFMAMEFLEGHTLHRVLRDEGFLSAKRAMKICRQVCRSLREAHDNGVIHRDLKPANIFLISDEEEDDFVKVLDFGLVKNVARSGEDLTKTGMFMGSPKYMSPEQIRGEEIDQRCDVYALGIIMYQMLSGKVPFNRKQQVNTLIAHLHEQPPSIRETCPQNKVPKLLEQVVMKALEKSPDDRFADMGEFLSALQVVGSQIGDPVSTSRPIDAGSVAGALGTTDQPADDPTETSPTPSGIVVSMEDEQAGGEGSPNAPAPRDPDGIPTDPPAGLGAAKVAGGDRIESEDQGSQALDTRALRREMFGSPWRGWVWVGVLVAAGLGLAAWWYLAGP